MPTSSSNYGGRLGQESASNRPSPNTGRGNISALTKGLLQTGRGPSVGYRSSVSSSTGAGSSSYSRKSYGSSSPYSYQSSGVDSSSTSYMGHSGNILGGYSSQHTSSSQPVRSTSSGANTSTASVGKQFGAMGLGGGAHRSSRNSGSTSLHRPRESNMLPGSTLSPSTSATKSTYTTSSRYSQSSDSLGGEDENNNRLPRISRSPGSKTSLDGDAGCFGISNIGNTCFMNSILQCLSNTKPLLDYMRREYRVDINSNSEMRGELAQSYGSLMEALWDTQSSYPSLTIRDSIKKFKSSVQRYAPRFSGYNQQDAQEFLRYLLEGLHEDVNSVKVRPKGLTYNEQEEERMSAEEKSREYWSRYLKFDNSRIVEVFVGQLRSTLTCQKCHYKSVTFDPFWDLSLQIPNKSNVAITDCLAAFTKEEILDGDEMPTCARCKERRRCSKELAIQRFPEILVLHLKRFSGDRFRSKLSKKVSFPQKLQDLYQFAADRGSIPSYNLYGVCCHSGSVYSGHYVAYCQNPINKRWFLFDDSRVTQAGSSDSVDSSEAYVLFYQKEGK